MAIFDVEANIYSDRTENVSTGTTIIACKFKGGVILGADTRTSAGNFVVNRASRKISQIHDRIFVCRSGSAADTQAVTKIVKKVIGEHSIELGHAPRVGSAASVFQSICYEYKDRLMAGLIVGGWDIRHGAQIYSIPLSGSKFEVSYTAGGSGSVFVTAYMDSNYKPDMTKEECLAFVQKTISHAISRDGSSGGLVRTVVITQNAVEEQVLLGNQLSVHI